MTTDTELSANLSGGIVNLASGSFTSDGNAGFVELGFTATHVKLWDETDTIVWEWNALMAATHTFKVVAAGTMTVDTTTAISAGADGQSINFSSGALGTGKAISWVAY
jgi:hypothetical protein